jgi:crossover junction endodeoxyribonuclease RuvC
VIVLGIDPSLCNTGIAAIALGGIGERIVELEVVRTSPSGKKRRIRGSDDDVRRVEAIVERLDAAVAKHRPVALVMEAPAGSKGARAARALALAAAAVVAVAKLRGIPFLQVQPSDVKRAMCGARNASKDDVILAVERRFNEVPWPMPESVWEHAADAIGAVISSLDADVVRLARRLSA